MGRLRFEGTCSQNTYDQLLLELSSRTLERWRASLYQPVVKNGFPLRFFKVDMLAFEKNQFEITEKLIREPSEIKTRIDLG